MRGERFKRDLRANLFTEGVRTCNELPEEAVDAETVMTQKALEEWMYRKARGIFAEYRQMGHTDMYTWLAGPKGLFVSCTGQ